MNPYDPSRNDIGETGWQLLGELELPADSNRVDGANVPLAKLLAPLNLRTDFMNRILKSAQDALARAMQAGPVMNFEHVHLLLFVPPDPDPGEKNWGFFRIEKIDHESDGIPAAAHTIEFYLYWESQEDIPFF